MAASPPVGEIVKRLQGVAACCRLTSQWLPLSLAYFRIRKLDYPYSLRLRTGEVLTLREFTDVIIFWLVFVREHYPVKATDRFVVDVGANVGIFTLYASRKAPAAHIIAVEPFPDTFDRLNDTIRANHLESRVTAIRCAITSAGGTAAMDDSEGVPSQYRSILSELPEMLNAAHKKTERPGSGLSVPTITLTGLLKTVNQDRIDLLKMNIHGNEYDVLLPTPDSALARFSRICLQYHELPKETGLGKIDLLDKMRHAGFQLLADEDTNRGAGRAIFSLSPQPIPPVPAAA